jgi:hypothetical protein
MTQEEIIDMARKAGIAKHGLGWTCWEGQLEAFAKLVAAKEREACAKVCDERFEKHPDLSIASGEAGMCAHFIRARGKA